MVDEIASDRIVTPSVDRDLYLGTNAVGARDEHRLVEAGWNAKHPAESAESAENARCEGRFDELLYSILGGVGGVYVYSGASVAKRFVAHAGSSSSNVTKRRMSRIL